MKRLFLFGLAAIMMVACTNDEVWYDDNSSKDNTAERYMSISLVANNQTTRAEATFANGDASEYAVAGGDYIVFYFFDADGNAFSVAKDEDNKDLNYLVPKKFGTQSDDGTVTETGSLNFTPQTDGGSVTSISDLILVLENQSGSTPSQVVALVNAPASYKQSYATLTALRQALVDATASRNKLVADNATEYFLMSNSAYRDSNGDDVYATPIESKNLASSITDAAKNPVEIYVERVDAKVSVKLSESQTLSDGKLYLDVENTGIDYAEGTAAPDIKARIDGWTLFNKSQQAYLIKDIDGIASQYNDVQNFRSYWAKTPKASVSADATTTFNSILFEDSEGLSNYCEYALENTGNNDSNSDPYTSIIFAATIGTTNTSGAFEPLTIASWLSKNYTESQLRTAIANYIGNELYSYTTNTEGTVWSRIAPEDIAFYVTDDGYHVSPKLSEAGLKKLWATSKTTSGQLGNEETAVNTVNTTLATVPKAQIWNQGRCYYYARITHSSENGRVPGVVRNHWYQVTVNGVSGLGTPVYDPDTSFDPVTPTTDGEDTWYLDATINVQSWKIEDVGITLGVDN